MPNCRKPDPSFPPKYDIYQKLNLAADLTARDTEPARKQRIHKHGLRERHHQKLHRNFGFCVMVVGLGGCIALSHNVTGLILSGFAASIAAVHVYRRDGKVYTADGLARQSLANLPAATAKADDQRLNAELLRYRTPRFLPVRPVRALGNLFDRLFATTVNR